MVNLLNLTKQKLHLESRDIMNVAQELKVLRLGQRPEMRFKTGEEDSSPVFLLHVLSGTEELEATINARNYLEENFLPESLYELILRTEKLAIALKDSDGQRYFTNGTELRNTFTEEECGALLTAYQGLLVHYKTLEHISEEKLKELIEGVHMGKPVESI